MPREIFTYTANTATTSFISLPAEYNDQPLSNKIKINNNAYILYDDKNISVGKIILATNSNYFKIDENNTSTISNTNYLIAFEDKEESYVIFNMSFRSIPQTQGYINKNLRAKAVGTGGKYLGKNVTVDIKIDENTKIRKVILKY